MPAAVCPSSRRAISAFCASWAFPSASMDFTIASWVAFCSVVEALMAMSCSTVVNWASCVAICWPSIGLSGS
jgi:hypothetical protein